jgi:lantibiotic biosynthesis dehydratase-like protein
VILDVKSQWNDRDLKPPDHLAPLPGGRWGVWRWVCLRGAGFPAQQILKLSAPRSAQACDYIFEAEREVYSAREEAVGKLTEHLVAPASGRLRRRALKAFGKPMALASADLCHLRDDAGDLWAAKSRLQSAQRTFSKVFEEESLCLAQAIHTIAREERFREALIWQNRRALHTGIDSLLRHPPNSSSRGSKQRRNEEMVARYLQRFCTKNDTIGFFGPVGWATLVPEGRPFCVKPGHSLVASREVFLEVWCIDELCAALMRDGAILPWVPPRRSHLIHLEGQCVYLPMKSPVQLNPEEAALLHACDGKRTPKELAAELICDPALRLRTERGVYDIIYALRARGFVSWELQAPIDPHPEWFLREVLNRIDDVGVSNKATKALQEIESLKAEVERSVGNSAELDRAFEKLEAAFTRRTGSPATHSNGSTYAGRTLLYEDCRRDIDVKIGPQLLQSLGPPLSILLTAARWLTFQFCERYSALAEEVYSQLSRKLGSRAVPFVSFWYLFYPRLWNDKDQIISTIESQFQTKWRTILALGERQDRAEYTVGQLYQAVSSEFYSPDSGWKSIRYNSPDILIAASAADAIQRGDCTFVLGELHLGVNTLNTQLFVTQHPDPSELFRATETDLGPRLVPIVPKNYAGKSSRSSPVLISSADYLLELASEPFRAEGSRTLPIGSLILENDSGLSVRTRDGKLHFGIADVLSQVVSAKIANSFKILAPHVHNPRVTFDQLIVSRESWSSEVEELTFTMEKTEAMRYCEARRWAKKHNMPRFVFAKVPSERKPLFLDLESPYSIAILTRSVRQLGEASEAKKLITLSEMIPSLSELWLPDIDGLRYTSELRFVAVECS